MFRRVYGLSPEETRARDNPEEYKPNWLPFYFDRSGSRTDRPVVDVGAPPNLLDETHQLRQLGTMQVPFGFHSIWDFNGPLEEIPNADSHSTLYTAGLLFTYGELLTMMGIKGRLEHGLVPYAQWSIRPYYSLYWRITFARATIANAFGSLGFCFAYEFCYTHVPYLKIRDPTPNGWRRAWEPGQSTYMSRAVQAVFPTLAWAFFRGSMQRTFHLYVVLVALLWQYEFYRAYVSGGTRMMMAFQARRNLEDVVIRGNLVPNMNHRTDPDTGKLYSTAQFRYLRTTTGMLQEDIWKGATHDTMPMSKMGNKFPNPYFNWRKAPQTYNEKIWKCKNDLWELPVVLDGRMMSGVMD